MVLLLLLSIYMKNGLTKTRIALILQQKASERVPSNNKNTNMSFKSLPRAPMAVTDVEKEHLNQKPTTSREKELQIVSLSPSPFKLPDGWLVEERPRHSNPFHFDRYYYEPSTRRQFRSLVAVQRFLTEERDYLTTERIISENKYTTYIESRTGQRLRAYEGYLARENASRATPKSVVKSITGKRSARGVKSSQNPAKKCFSVGEDKITLKAASIQSTHSEKTDSEKKFIFGEDERGSVHNLTRPPAKVSWVLSGPGGFWSPFLDDSIVPENEKLKWSEAFVQSIREGVINS